jgi:hypothetical protein
MSLALFMFIGCVIGFADSCGRQVSRDQTIYGGVAYTCSMMTETIMLHLINEAPFYLRKGIRFSSEPQISGT